MREIELNAVHWKRPDDFYDDLLSQLEAPSWHGRNLDALNDSVFGGTINGVEPPFRVVIHSALATSEGLRTFLHEVQALFEGGRRETGRDVRISLL